MARSPDDRLKLAILINASGNHVAGWRHPESGTEKTGSLSHYLRVAQKAEEGKFDIIFFADSSALYDGTPEHQARVVKGLEATEPKRHLEPFTLLSAIATQTSHVGLVGSATTTYEEPFHVARILATLDHLSDGRAGWNLITSANPAEAQNFSRDKHVAHADRYDRAEEFVDVVRGLWDTIDDGAFVRNRETGQYADLSKIRTLDHVGKHFSVRGPLNVARPPQGHPLIAQAGSSEPGMRLAARTADMVFTAQRNLDSARKFYADIKARVAAEGRDPAQVLVVPGIVPFVGRTKEDAEAFHRELQALIKPEVGLALLTELLGEFDLSTYPLDGPLPPIDAIPEGSKSRFELVTKLARANNYSIRQTYENIASASGHGLVIGSPEEIADHMELWFKEEACDGFNLLPPVTPKAFDDFVDLVVPELQRRGIVQSDYGQGTLRERLGLPRPDNSL